MSKTKEGSRFLHKVECPLCQSQQGCCLYDDGHMFCFSCEKYQKASDHKEGDLKKVSTIGSVDLAPMIAGGAYKSTRGIAIRTMQKYRYKIIHNASGEVVHLAPYFNDEGDQVAQHLRYENDKTKAPWKGDTKTSGEVFFGQNTIRKAGKKLYICEGEIDTMSLSQALGNTWDVIGCPGSSTLRKLLEKNIEWVEKYEQVFIVFDGDDAGRKGARKGAEVLSPGKCKLVDMPNGKDVNDILQEQGGMKALQQLIWDAKEFRPDGIVSADSMKERMDAWFTGEGRAESLSLGRPILDQLTKGVRKKEICLLVAGTGIGKSTAGFEYAEYLRSEHSQRVGVIALEEDNVESLLRFMSIRANKPIHMLPTNEDGSVQGISKEDFDKYYEETAGAGNIFFYDHYGAVDSDNLINKIKYLAVGCQCDFILLDHITIAISLEGKQNEAADYLMNALKTVVEQTGVGIIAVAHLRKTGNGGKGFEEGGQVSLDDIKGSGSLKQIPNTIIASERNQQAGDDSADITRLRVLKCRFTGRTGPAGHTRYNEETGRIENFQMPEGDVGPLVDDPRDIPIGAISDIDDDEPPF
jgi:twinkle protein